MDSLRFVLRPGGRSKLLGVSLMIFAPGALTACQQVDPTPLHGPCNNCVDPPPNGGWDDEEDGSESYPDIWAQVHLSNQSSADAYVQLRQLRADVEVDCPEVSKDPARLLPDAAFEGATAWKLPPWTNVAAGEIPGTRSCHAVIVSGQSVEPTLLFWHSADLSADTVPGQYRPGASPRRGAVLFGDSGGGFAYEDFGGRWHYDLESAPELPEECRAPGDGGRLAYTGLDQEGTFRLVDAQWGPDGCGRLSLISLENWQEQELEPEIHYLCVDEALFPIEPGDWFTNKPATGNSVDGVYVGRVLKRLGPDLMPTSPQAELVFSHHGDGVPAVGVDLVPREVFECEFAVDDSCAETSRALYLQPLGLDGVIDLHPGEDPVAFSPDPGVEIQMQLMYGRRRIVRDACAEGSPQLGDDLEVAALIRRD